MFDALVLRDDDSAEGRVSARIDSLEPEDLPGDGEVLVRVQWSGINYKDALAVTGRGKIVRGSYPFVPGIDMAGTVLQSDDERFAEHFEREAKTLAKMSHPNIVTVHDRG